MSKRPIAFLPGARHSEVHLENSRINIGENIINNQLAGPYGSELQQLIHYCLLGALVDSKEQYDMPQCEPETREAMIQQIDDWGRNRDGKSVSVMWLRGGAGAGKSTLAQTIAMMYKREGLLVGSFFFSNRRTNGSDGNAMIITLVLQLLVTFPAVAPFIFEVLKRNPMILTSSPQEHMQQLFVGPLNAMNAIEPNPLLPYLLKLFIFLMFALQSLLGPIIGDLPYGHHIFVTPNTPNLSPCLIVIDGLDECDDETVPCRLLHIIATAIPKLSQPLRFLIASRPEAHIERTFEQDDALSAAFVQQVDLSANRDADADIERYLRRRFSAVRRTHPFKHLPKNWPSDSDIWALVRRSSKHFIYPSTVMTFIEDPTDFPHRLLETVLNPNKRTSTSDPLAPLNELYMLIFSRVKERDLPIIRLFFGLLYLRQADRTFGRFWQQFAPAEGASERHVMDNILQLEKGYLDVIMQPLRSLVYLPTDPNDDDNPDESHDGSNRAVSNSDHHDTQNFRIFHATLLDFLMDSARSNDYHVDLGWVHEELAKCFIAQLFERKSIGMSDDLSNYIFGFKRFIVYCKRATISDHSIPSYLETCDFLYATLIPSIPCIPGGETNRLTTPTNLLPAFFEFLNLVCRQDIDPTGRFRLEHLHKMEEALLAKLPTEHQLGRVKHYQASQHIRETDDHLNPDYVPTFQYELEFEDICSLLAQWCPKQELLIQNIHPERDSVLQKEANIIRYFMKPTNKAWTMKCGPLQHLVFWLENDTVLIISYDFWGRSFQTYAGHLKTCEEILKMGENAPWSRIDCSGRTFRDYW
ncbi:hypothetical protein CPB83DRAFT_896841 [Crepidotus variabilis]|uniref:Nephrocystin 3-like N-terminal domain-containing protein n=1 Tax=Crepidotus variabilis TaxID=179855 RepID=A0A9P6EAY1_9AGAR|nr:hypothetical protein CPB83DRAFT_896841 [Crepidotus variabilis]